MRNLLLYGFVGLISVGSLAGCGLMRDFREKKRDNCCDNKCSLCRVSRPTNGGHVVLDATSWPKSVGEPIESVPITQAPESATKPPTHLPSSEHKPGESALLAQEMALLDRKAAVLASKSAPPRRVEAGDTAKSGDVSTIETEIVPTPSKEIRSEKTRSDQIPAGQAENFKSITGQVQEFRKTLRLRYAPIDQVDIYGGSVILEGGPELSQLKDGQRVRVRGELIPPTDRGSSARYRVLAVEILD